MPFALGLIETNGLVAALEAADAMLKAANVRLLSKEQTNPALITIQIIGDVAAVKAAVEAGAIAAARIGTIVSTHVIPRPDEGLEVIVPGILEEDEVLNREQVEPDEDEAEPLAESETVVELVQPEAVPEESESEVMPDETDDETFAGTVPPDFEDEPLAPEVKDSREDLASPFEEEKAFEQEETENISEQTGIDDFESEFDGLPELPKPVEMAIEDEASASETLDEPIPDYNEKQSPSTYKAEKWAAFQDSLFSAPSLFDEEATEPFDAEVESEFPELEYGDEPATEGETEYEDDRMIGDETESLDEAIEEELTEDLSPENEESQEEDIVSLTENNDTKVPDASVVQNESSTVEQPMPPIDEETEALWAQDIMSLNVHQLRKLARHTGDFPIVGRDISKANRQELLYYFDSLKNKSVKS